MNHTHAHAHTHTHTSSLSLPHSTFIELRKQRVVVYSPHNHREGEGVNRGGDRGRRRCEKERVAHRERDGGRGHSARERETNREGARKR